jgi:hypothetical protein
MNTKHPWYPAATCREHPDVVLLTRLHERNKTEPYCPTCDLERSARMRAIFGAPETV